MGYEYEMTEGRPCAAPRGPGNGPARLLEIAHRRGKQRQAEVVIGLLMSGAALPEAAQKSGIGHRTLKRWSTAAWFQAEYAAARQELLTSTIDRLRSIGADAVEALRSVICNGDSPPAARVSAARAALELLLRAVELQDLATRLDKLEKRDGGGYGYE